MKRFILLLACLLFLALAGCGDNNSNNKTAGNTLAKPVTPGATAGTSTSAGVGNSSGSLIYTGTSVTLDGSLSTATSGTLTYSWRMIARPANSSAVLVDPTTSTPSFMVDQPGLYKIGLTVTDAVATSSEAIVIIWGETAEIPQARVAAFQVVTPGALTELNGTLSSVAMGRTASYSWSVSQAPPGSNVSIDNPTSAKPTVFTDLPGTYLFSLVVSDGYQSSSATIETVYADNMTSLTVTPGANDAMSVGQSKRYNALGNFPVIKSVSVANIALWSSSDSSIATVDSKGVVKALRTGVVTISAEVNGCTGSTVLTVK